MELHKEGIVGGIQNGLQQYDRYLIEFDNLENYGRRYSIGVRMDF